MLSKKYSPKQNAPWKKMLPVKMLSIKMLPEKNAPWKNAPQEKMLPRKKSYVDGVDDR